MLQLRLYLSNGFTSFSAGRYLRISSSRCSFKVMRPRSRSRQHATQKLLAGNRWGLIGISVHLWPWVIFSYFLPIQALSFECLKLAASFSVWRYIFRRSPSVTGLISRSRSHNSSSTQVCALPDTLHQVMWRPMFSGAKSFSTVLNQWLSVYQADVFIPGWDQSLEQ